MKQNEIECEIKGKKETKEIEDRILNCMCNSILKISMENRKKTKN